MSEPSLIDLVQELRKSLGLFDGAMPVSPKQAWEEALSRIDDLRNGVCYRCMDKTAWRGNPSVEEGIEQ